MAKINVKLYDPKDNEKVTMLSECTFIDEKPANEYINYYRELSYYVVVNEE